MRFVLVSDVHLDRTFAWAAPAVARRRRRAIRDAFAAALAVADRTGADAVLVGGDLYERDRCSPDTRAFVRDRLSELDRPVFVAPGNHDCYDPRSIYAQLDWPDRVRIFREDRLMPVQLEDGLTLWGAAHTAPGGTGNFLDGFRVDRGGVHLALFHGSLDAGLGAEDRAKQPHAPFSRHDLESSGIDHALLGHYHRPRHEDRLTYPGNPEPLTFGEQGRRGAVEVEVHADGSVSRTVHDVAQTSVEDLSCDISGAGSLFDVRERVGELLEGHHGCVRVWLTGTKQPSVELDLDAVAEAGAHLEAVVVRDDRLGAGYDLAAIRRERGVRGQFVRDVEAADQLSERQRRRVLVTGLRAMDGREDLEVG